MQQSEMDLKVEAMLLATALRREDLRQEILDDVRPESFGNARHRILFEAIQALHDRGQPVDRVSVQSQIEHKGAGHIVTPAYIDEILSIPGTDAKHQSLSARVRRQAGFRELAALSQRLSEISFKQEGDPFELMESVSAEAAELASGQKRGQTKDARSAAMAVVERMDAIRSGDPRALGLSTGFDELDNMLGGMCGGELIVVAAGASVGKSAFALTVGMHVANQGRCVLLTSLEMSGLQIGQRLVAFDSGVSANKTQRPNLMSATDYARLSETVNRLGGLPFMFTDDCDMTIGGVRSEARLVARTKGLDLLIVDYLQLMEGSGKYGNRERDVAEISRGLKKLAKELGIPVIALAQINRDSAKRSGDARKPQLHDLRESGAIEQDADKVLMLWREDRMDPNAADSGEAEILVRKNRNGPCGAVQLEYIAERMRFKERRRCA